jgi:hypothetical protein
VLGWLNSFSSSVRKPKSNINIKIKLETLPIWNHHPPLIRDFPLWPIYFSCLSPAVYKNLSRLSELLGARTLPNHESFLLNWSLFNLFCLKFLSCHPDRLQVILVASLALHQPKADHLCNHMSVETHHFSPVPCNLTFGSVPVWSLCL